MLGRLIRKVLVEQSRYFGTGSWGLILLLK